MLDVPFRGPYLGSKTVLSRGVLLGNLAISCFKRITRNASVVPEQPGILLVPRLAMATHLANVP